MREAGNRNVKLDFKLYGTGKFKQIVEERLCFPIIFLITFYSNEIYQLYCCWTLSRSAVVTDSAVYHHDFLP